MIAWPLIGFNYALDGFNHRRLWDARIGEGCVNLGELVRLDVGISRTFGLNQKPAHAAVATQRTNSLQLLRCAFETVSQPDLVDRNPGHPLQSQPCPITRAYRAPLMPHIPEKVSNSSCRR